MLDLTSGVRAAIVAFGTRTALAEALGIHRSAVSQWQYVPHKQVLRIEEASGGKVTREQMRPDLYPPRQTRRKAA